MKRTTPLKRSGRVKAKTPAAKTEKWYRNKCDELARLRCLENAGHKCEACAYEHPKSTGCSFGPLQWCHLKSRRFVRLRHDPENAVCMCAAHHRFFTDHPDCFRDFIEDLYPGRWQSLNEKLCEDIKVRYKLVYEGLVELSEAA